MHDGAVYMVAVEVGTIAVFVEQRVVDAAWQCRRKKQRVAMQCRLHHTLQLGGQLAALRELQVVLLVHRLPARTAGAVDPGGIGRPELLPKQCDLFGRQHVFDVQEHGADCDSAPMKGRSRFVRTSTR
ncbi:hypothetical protein D3C71_1736850 [compost metagenome]